MKELQHLYELIDHEMNAKAASAAAQEKPQVSSDEPFAMGTPTTTGGADYRHPVIKKRDEVDAARAQGNDILSAHQSVYGETDLGNIQSKAGLSSTLSRVQQPEFSTGIQLEPEKGSILSKDFQQEKEQDQVTPDDMHTPMRGQIPDQLQTAGENIAVQAQENVNTPETQAMLDLIAEIDYNDDVAYLQKYGRA